MTYIVTQNCYKCKYTDCAESCPVEAFHEGPEMLYINPDTCIDCDACRELCPVGAIFAGDDFPEKFKPYFDQNAAECKKTPVITQKKDALPTAKTKEEVEKAVADGTWPDPLKS